MSPDHTGAITGEVRLDVSGLSLDVPGRCLLDGVAFSARSGECLAVVGPSGSGKTSLLNCLSGISAPSRGSVKIDGIDLTTLASSKRSTFRLRHVGMVFQFGELLPELSASENVSLPLRFMGVARREAERQAAEWLARVGLSGRERDHPDVLSGGETLRLAIARALIHAPELILADEPTGALDEENTKQVVDLLAHAGTETGATVVVATHDPLVASRADRVLRLRGGRLAPADRPEPLTGTAP